MKRNIVVNDNYIGYDDNIIDSEVSTCLLL
jgi:hypothetical protein